MKIRIRMINSNEEMYIHLKEVIFKRISCLINTMTKTILITFKILHQDRLHQVFKIKQVLEAICQKMNWKNQAKVLECLL